MAMKAATVAIAIAAPQARRTLVKRLRMKTSFSFYNCSPLYVVMAVEAGFQRTRLETPLKVVYGPRGSWPLNKQNMQICRVYANRLPSGIYLMELHFRKGLADWQSLNWPGNSENTVSHCVAPRERNKPRVTAPI